MVRKFAVFLTFAWCAVVACKAYEGDGDGDLDVPRVVLDKEEWKPIEVQEARPPEWTEDVSETTEAPPLPRRRRVRKRKRRPQIPIVVEDEAEVRISSRKRLRPVQLDASREPWDEMVEEDSYRRPYTRRRVTPKYPEEDAVEETKVEEKIRDPFTALQEEEEKAKRKQEGTTTVAPDTTVKLKAVLKQTGSLSLSELLQQKNLTLAELLKGDPQVLSALTEKPDTRNEIVSEYNNALGTSTEPPDDSSTTEDVKKKRVFAEVTTERRAFVPSNPKYLAPEEENLVQETKITVATSEKSTTVPEIITIKRKEAITNRLLLKPKLRMPLLTTTTTMKAPEPQSSEENYPKLSLFPSKVFKINMSELFGQSKTSPTEKTDKGPFKMTFDIETMTKNPSGDLEITTNLIDTSPENEKLRAKNELMDILKDPISRDRLARILDIRNMTLEELVEHRERGSSQLHLADIFHSRTKEPEPNEEHVGHVPVEIPAVFRHETISERPKPTYTVTSFPKYRIQKRPPTQQHPVYRIEIETPNQRQPHQLFPAWGSVFPNVYAGGYENTNKEPVMDYRDLNEIPRLEEVDNEIAESVNQHANVEPNRNYSEEVALPTGVKSAILASSAIVGVSLMVFLTIFGVFRWSQRQKRKLNYTNSFSECRIKSPILEGYPKRSIKTIMTETLGRSKAYYKSYVPNLSDITWERDKKAYM